MESIKTICKKLIKSTVTQLGYRIEKGRHQKHVQVRQNVLKDVNLVIDIGANVGQYATDIRTLGYNGQILSFEPLSDAYSELEAKASCDENWKVFNKAVGEKTI